MADALIYFYVVAFPELRGAESTVAQLKSKRKLTGVKAALILRKDHTGRPHTQDIGLTPVKGALAGVVLGSVVGILSGGSTPALGALGGVLNGQKVKRTRRKHLTPGPLQQLTEVLAPGYSAILIVSTQPIPPEVQQELESLGAEIFSTEISAEKAGQLEEHGDAAYAALVEQLESARAPVEVPYRRIHVVINSAAGQDEPVLNTLNSVFYPYGIEWDVSLTRKFGDATESARRAAESGYDLVVGYGGDGTQHEIANGIIGTKALMGVLPGGTGNGDFAGQEQINFCSCNCYQRY
jgi:uncharacterized membrane protein